MCSFDTGRCAELQVHVTEATATAAEQRELIARLEQDLSTIQTIQRPDAEVSRPLCPAPLATLSSHPGKPLRLTSRLLGPCPHKAHGAVVHSPGTACTLHHRGPVQDARPQGTGPGWGLHPESCGQKPGRKTDPSQS